MKLIERSEILLQIVKSKRQQANNDIKSFPEKRETSFLLIRQGKLINFTYIELVIQLDHW